MGSRGGGATEEECVDAAMDVIATLCAANGGSYRITVPDHIREAQGDLVIRVINHDTLEFSYLPNGLSYQ